MSMNKSIPGVFLQQFIDRFQDEHEVNALHE
jgi:hypothetical protein